MTEGIYCNFEHFFSLKFLNWIVYQKENTQKLGDLKSCNVSWSIVFVIGAVTWIGTDLNFKRYFPQLGRIQEATDIPLVCDKWVGQHDLCSQDRGSKHPAIFVLKSRCGLYHGAPRISPKQTGTFCWTRDRVLHWSWSAILPPGYIEPDLGQCNEHEKQALLAVNDPEAWSWTQWCCWRIFSRRRGQILQVAKTQRTNHDKDLGKRKDFLGVQAERSHDFRGEVAPEKAALKSMMFLNYTIDIYRPKKGTDIADPFDITFRRTHGEKDGPHFGWKHL